MKINVEVEVTDVAEDVRSWVVNAVQCSPSQPGGR